MKPFFKSRMGAIFLALGLLVVVVFLVGLLGSMEPKIPRRALEAALRTDLCVMRTAIDNYTADKREPPRSLDELLEGHYLPEIPVDPITRKKDWVVEFDDVVLSPHSKAYGVANVRSSSGVDGGCGSRRDIMVQ